MTDTTDVEARRYVAVALALEAATDVLASNETVTVEVREAVAEIMRTIDAPA